MSTMLFISTFLPMFASLLVLIKNDRRYTSFLSSLSLAISFIIMLYIAYGSGILTSSSSAIYQESFSWQPLGNVGFRLDNVSLTFSLMIGFSALMISIYSYFYMSKHFEYLQAERWSTYYFLYLTFVFGMLGTVMSTNLLEFYIFFELMLIPSYFLIAEFGFGDRSRASFSYFLWTHIGALIMLAGLIAIAFSYRTLDMNAIYIYTHSPQGSTASATVILYASIAVLAGLMVKLGGFGLHVWLPSAYREAPPPVSAALSALMSGIAGYAIIRILALGLPTAFSVISPYLIVWGIISLIYGGYVALHQDDIRLLLAYSSISQMGYMAIGIGSNTAFGIAGSISMYAANGVAKSILFMMAGILLVETGRLNVNRMEGLAGKYPYLAAFSIIGFLTMMGVPPTIGFIAEFFLFQGLFASALLNNLSILSLSFLALLGSIITTAYSLWAIKKIFFGKQVQHENISSNGQKSILLSGRYSIIPLSILAAASIIIGIYPILFSNSLAYLFSILKSAAEVLA